MSQTSNLFTGTADVESWKGILVYVELKEGKPRDASLELFAAGHKLKESLGEEVSAVILGKEVAGFAGMLASYGAEKVYVAEHELLEHYAPDAYTSVLSRVILDNKPSTVLYPATPNCRDFASKIAARLKTGLAADCIDLKINEKKQMVQIRPDFGGKDLRSEERRVGKECRL